MKAATQRNTPATLHAAAQARADSDHARRTAELKALAPLLARMDALVPALKARGLELHHSSLRLDHHLPTGYYGRQYAMLDLWLHTWCSDEQALFERWWQAFAALGFAVVEWGSADSSLARAVLRRGPLLIGMRRPASVSVPTKAPAAGQPQIIVRSAHQAPPQLPCVVDDFGAEVPASPVRHLASCAYGFHVGVSGLAEAMTAAV